MGRPDPHTPTVLVVDDQAEIVRLLARTLGAAGFVVLTAGGGAEAVEVYRRDQGGIDLVLLDVQMPPPLNGPDTLRELQRIDPAVRAAFMSGSAGDYTGEQLLGLGAVRVFAKPFASLTQLVESLHELIPA